MLYCAVYNLYIELLRNVENKIEIFHKLNKIKHEIINIPITLESFIGKF